MSAGCRRTPGKSRSIRRPGAIRVRRAKREHGRTMLKGLAAGACAIVLGACTSSVNLQAPTPSPVNLADTPAPDLRVHLYLLLVEHATALGNLAVAAAAGRKDEFRAHAGALSPNRP